MCDSEVLHIYSALFSACSSANNFFLKTTAGSVLTFIIIILAFIRTLNRIFFSTHFPVNSKNLLMQEAFHNLLLIDSLFKLTHCLVSSIFLSSKELLDINEYIIGSALRRWHPGNNINGTHRKQL